MPTVTLVGGSGLIGTALRSLCAARGIGVRVLDLVPPHGSLAKNEVFVCTDVREPIDPRHLEDSSAVVVLAALLGKRCAEDPEDGWRTNVVGTTHLLEAIRQSGANPATCFLSSASVYRRWNPQDGPIPEHAPLEAGSLYAASKLMGEQAMRAAGHAFGLRSFILRPFTAYGPGPGSAFKGHFVSTWVERANSGCPLVVHGDGRQTVDLVHVADLAELVLQALDAGIASDRPPVFNIGCGRETTLLQMLDWLRGAVEGLRVEFDSSKSPQQPRNFADIGAARSKIGFCPKIAPHDGVLATLRDGKAA